MEQKWRRTKQPKIKPIQTKWKESCGFRKTLYDMPYSCTTTTTTNSTGSSINAHSLARTHTHTQLGVYSLVMALLARTTHIGFWKVGTLSDNICTILLTEFRHLGSYPARCVCVCVCGGTAAMKLKNNLTLPKNQKLQNAFQIVVAIIYGSNYICFARTRKFKMETKRTKKTKKKWERNWVNFIQLNSFTPK